MEETMYWGTILEKAGLDTSEYPFSSSYPCIIYNEMTKRITSSSEILQGSGTFFAHNSGSLKAFEKLAKELENETDPPQIVVHIQPFRITIYVDVQRMDFNRERFW